VEQLEDRVTPSTLIPLTGVRDHVFDPTRGLLYITRSTGTVERYDVNAGTLLSPLSVGTSLNGLDITPDGNFLYVAEGQLSGGRGVVHKVDLNTGTVTDLTYTGDNGTFDIAIANNGKAFFDAMFAGSGWVGFRQIDLATDAITTRTDTGGSGGGGQVRQNSLISRGADRSLLFVTESNISNGPIFTYDAASDSFPRHLQTGGFHDNDLSAVNRSGSLIALESGSGISILDRDLNAVQTLPGVDGGMAFDPLRDTLYAVNSTTDQIIAYNTTTWAERFRMPVDQNVGASSAFGSGVMTVSSDSRFLFLSVGNGVRVYELPNNPGVAASLQVSGFPAFIGQGTPGSFTVTVQDNLGDTVTTYTGTVTFSSSDGSATLPGSYTFTPADQGQHTFTATFNTVGTQTLTARDQAMPSIMGSQTGIIVHAPGAALIPVTAHRDLVYDPVRNLLYITTSNGRVERYDPVGGTLLAPFAVGNTLNGADITPDSAFLYVAEGQQVGAGGLVRKVNLATGAATSISYSGGAGTWDIAITNNGRAFFDSRFAGSGSVNLNQIDLSTDAVTTRRSVTQDTNLARGADRSFLFITQANISSGPINAYNPATDSFVLTQDRGTAAFYDNQLLTVNRNGTLVATELGFANSGSLYYGVSIMDRNLNAVENLGPNFDGGILFDPTRDLLYAIDSTADQIVAFDTNTWTERFRIAVGENLGPSTAFGSGVMAVSNDGRFLFLGTPSGVRVYGLPENPGVVSQLRVSGFPAFTGQGTPGTFTVTALDALGSVVTNYTGTVTFTSSDGSAALPGSYTFTPADQGRHTFTATFNTVGTQTLTARDQAMPSITGSEGGIQIHNNVVSVVPVLNHRDLVYDPQRGLLYISTADGRVQVYDPATQTLLAPFNVGTSLNAIDITPDGSAAYVAESVRGATQGFLRKLNLTTGAVTNLAYNVGGGESGSWDVAIANNGKAFFSTRFEGSGFVQVREVLLSTDALRNRLGVTQNTHLQRGADRSLLALAQSNISSGPLNTYNAATDTFSPETDLGLFHDRTMLAVNRNGTLVAVELFNGNVQIRDRNLVLIQTLIGLDGGVAFDPVRDLLYAVNSTTDQIIAFNTSNFTERFRIPVGENVGSETPLGNGVMTLSDDGQYLFLATAAGVRVYNVGSLLPLTASPPLPASTGFTIHLSRPIDPALLNLYDQENGTLGPPDVVLTGPGGQAVRGSVVLNATNTAFTFIATGGMLAPGTYTVTLRSAANGFVDTAGGLLDGNGDLTPGDDFTASFTIAPFSGVTVGIPDFMRGPGQAVNVPADGTGLPLRLSDGAGVTAVSLTLRYDPRLLRITGASAAAGATVTLDTSIPGTAVLTFTSPTPLAAGPIDFVTLAAAVPDDAPYAFKEILNLTGVRVNNGAIAALDDDGLHVVGYLGDVTGNAVYTSADATRALRVALGLDGGFPAYQLADPVVIADVTGNGAITSTDATRILQAALGIPQTSIPPLPGIVPMIPTTGPDPLLNIPNTFRARPGEAVTVPVNLDLSEGLQTADIALSYDPRRLEVRGVEDVRRGSLTGDFEVFGVNLDARAGTIRVALGRTAGAVTGRGSGSVLEITFRVKPNALPGRAIINLRQSVNQTRTLLNDGGLELNPSPSNEAGDALDGVIRIMGREKPAAPRDPRLRPRAEAGNSLLAGLRRRPDGEHDEESAAPPDRSAADAFFRLLGTARAVSDDGALDLEQPLVNSGCERHDLLDEGERLDDLQDDARRW
jgi:sugar lactone lactonase YvrE